MTNQREYEEVLEVLGMLAKKSTINNKLNKIFAYSKDEKLRSMVGAILEKLPEKDINHQVFTLRDHKGLKTKEIETYCREKLGRDVLEQPVSLV